MKVVILAGGLGTRISEESHLIPKPMITIGLKPILWHIMKYYSSFGYNEFIILAGYKQNIIKEYFANYYINNSDIKFNLKSGKITEQSFKNEENWVVTILDSGIDSMTGGRLLSLSDYINEDNFLLTYGDGVSNVNLAELIQLHLFSNAMITITAIKPGGRFGALNIEKDSMISQFREKSIDDVSWINGGYMVVNRSVLDLIENSKTVLEVDIFKEVVKLNKLFAYRHTGYWQCMDTMRDRNLLETAIQEKNAPWIVWKNE